MSKVELAGQHTDANGTIRGQITVKGVTLDVQIMAGQEAKVRYPMTSGEWSVATERQIAFLVQNKLRNQEGQKITLGDLLARAESIDKYFDATVERLTRSGGLGR